MSQTTLLVQVETLLLDMSRGLIAQPWEYILETYTKEEIFIWWTWSLSMIIFWTGSLSFLMVDIFKPKFFYQYKIQPFNKPSNSLIIKTIAVVLGNNCLSLVLAFYFKDFMVSRLDFGKELPSIATVFGHFFVFGIVEEIGFYYSHRLFHVPFLYKAVHKIHHQHKAPIAISAQYCNPLEQMLSNVGPIIAGPTIMGSHVVLLWVWVSIALISTLTSHSGYDFPFLHRGSSRFHDMHHELFNCCYGTLGFLDWFHQTDLPYNQRYNTSSLGIYFKSDTEKPKGGRKQAVKSE